MAIKIVRNVKSKSVYAIGVGHPILFIAVNFGISKNINKQFEKFVLKVLDLCLSDIIENLGLRKPIYKNSASYGHTRSKVVDVFLEKVIKQIAMFIVVTQ